MSISPSFRWVCGVMLAGLEQKKNKKEKKKKQLVFDVINHAKCYTILTIALQQ